MDVDTCTRVGKYEAFTINSLTLEHREIELKGMEILLGRHHISDVRIEAGIFFLK